MSAYLEVLGRCHPMVLHLPVGTILALAVLELLSMLRREPLPRGFAGALVALTALSALAAAGSGWLLGSDPDYGASEVIFRHRWLGVGLASTSVLAALAFAAGATRAYRGLLLVAVALLFPAGHLGATMTHGRGFLTEPLRERPERRPAGGAQRPLAAVAPAEPTSPAAATTYTTAQAPTPPPVEAASSTYADVIAPILAGKCVACHGAEKQKGGFALHTPEAIRAAADELPLFVPDPPFGPALIERISLPPTDPDHMPPEGKPQLSAAQIALLVAWVEAGAPLAGRVELPGAADEGASPDVPQPEAPQESSETEPRAPAEPDAAALAALTQGFVHVERIEPASGGLWIDFAAVATTTEDAHAAALLAPLAEHVAHLDLARTRAGAETLALCATMPQLAHLDLRTTPVGDGELAALAEHPALVELVLTQTAVSSDSLELLLDLPKLERLFTWGSALSLEDVARLRAERPDLEVDDGTRPAAAVLEEEPEVRFTRPGEEATGETAAAALKPINSACPVSGSPVDARYGALYEGVLIGFCCANCPKQFWEDPATFAAKLD